MSRTLLRDQFTPEQRRDWKVKQIEYSTFQYEKDGETVIRQHATDIVRKRPDGSVILNTGGWKTVTTKARLNSYTPAGYSIYSHKGEWIVRDGQGRAVPFFDGMELPRDILKPPKKAANKAADDKKLQLAIARFVAKIDGLKELPAPDAGDCWFCSMFDREQGPKGTHAFGGPSCSGPSQTSSDHLREHVREGYLHGSLIMNALKWAGYRDPGVIWYMANADLKAGERRKHGTHQIVKRVLRRYLQRKLGLVGR